MTQVKVPDLLNKSPDEIKKELNELGLGVDKGGEEASESVEEGKICRQEPEAGAMVDKNTQVKYYISTGKAAKDVTIPSGLVGESLSEVEDTLQQLKLEYKIEKELSEDVEVGKVISLDPGEGSTVPEGTEVTIVVSKGEGDKMVKIPNLVGYTKEEGVESLTNSGLIVEVEEVYKESAGVAVGEIYEILPKPGTRVESGSTVVVRVLTEKQEETQEPEEQETQTGTESGGTSGTSATTGVKASVGDWAVRNVKLTKPTNYQGGGVQLRLVQNDNGDETSGGKIVLEGNSINFNEVIGDIVGENGVETGTLYFAEKQADGTYKTIYKYPLEFKEVQ